MDMEKFYELLPTINASLNGTASILLLAGFLAIKTKRKQLHKKLMITCFSVSCLFLACYLIYHYQVGSVPFLGKGWVRVLYFLVLIPHIILAAIQVPLILITLKFAVQGNFQRHRQFAKWTYPIWLYVSMTGVIIYWMLYYLPVA